MFTIHYAVCPVCQKKWKASSPKAARELEVLFGQALRFGALYAEGQKCWLWGTKEAEILEVHLDRCVHYKDGNYAHPLRYRVKRLSDGAIFNMPWRDLLPQPLTEVPTVKKGRREYRVNWRNYWNFFRESVGYH